MEAGCAGDLGGEVGDQRIDVLGPIAQRRDLDARDRQAEVQVGAKRPLVDLGAQIAVRRRDDADIDLDVFLAAEAAKRAAFEHAEQRRLHGQRQLTDLVEEDRAAVRQLERPFLPALRAGEGAPLVSEQLRRDQRRGQRAADRRR